MVVSGCVTVSIVRLPFLNFWLCFFHSLMLKLIKNFMGTRCGGKLFLFFEKGLGDSVNLPIFCIESFYICGWWNFLFCFLLLCFVLIFENWLYVIVSFGCFILYVCNYLLWIRFIWEQTIFFDVANSFTLCVQHFFHSNMTSQR